MLALKIVFSILTTVAILGRVSFLKNVQIYAVFCAGVFNGSFMAFAFLSIVSPIGLIIYELFHLVLLLIPPIRKGNLKEMVSVGNKYLLFSLIWFVISILIFIS